jgi:peptidoglycan/LPS O-acetylase OafA/YrhL
MRDRNLQLDLLRCGAIVGVLVAHRTIFHYPRFWWERLATGPSWTGVDLFFVLSGFLISGLLFGEFHKRGKINFSRFAIRRALKLYPTLYVLVLGVMFVRLIHSHFHQIGQIISPTVHDILFVQSYLPGTYGHFWSLAVEEHFYILLPLTLYVMLRISRADDPDPFRKLPTIFVLVATFCLSTRLIHAFLVQPYSPYTHLFPTHLRLDSLLFGVLLSYWYQFHTDTFRVLVGRALPALFPLSFLLIAPTFLLQGSNLFVHTVGLSCLYLGYGGLMIALLQVSLSTDGLFGRATPRYCLYRSAFVFDLRVPHTNHGRIAEVSSPEGLAWGHHLFCEHYSIWHCGCRID